MGTRPKNNSLQCKLKKYGLRVFLMLPLYTGRSLMKQLLILTLISFFIISIKASAQTSLQDRGRVLPNKLVEYAVDDLEHLAELQGYTLDRNEIRLSAPESNLLFILGPQVLVGAATFFTSGLGILSASSIAALYAGGSIVGLYGGVYATSPKGGQGLIKFRNELHYSVQSPSHNQTLEGACLLYLFFDRETEFFFYEIDSCTHNEVFPENEEGVLRVREHEHSIFDIFWGQTAVVATGRVDMPQLLTK